MSWGLGVARILILALALTMVVAGLVVLAFGGWAAWVPAIWLFGIALACVVAVFLEQTRYRSEATDRSGEPHGPGGGEPLGAAIEPRFRRSDEVFIDPTSTRTMRVWVDPGSGERRYVAED